MNTSSSQYQPLSGQMEGKVTAPVMSSACLDLHLLRQVMCVMRILGRPMTVESIGNVLSFPKALLLDYCSLIAPGCVGADPMVSAETVIAKLHDSLRQGNKLQSLLTLTKLSVDELEAFCARMMPKVRVLISAKRG